MDGVSLFSGNGSSFVDGISNDVHDSAESFGSDGDTDGCSGINYFLASDQPFGGIHGNGSDSRITQMLGNFEDESASDSFDFKGIEDGRDVSFELHVHDGTDDLL